MSLDAAALNEAANAIRRRANAMRAELALADELEKISAVENAVGEAQARLKALADQVVQEEAGIAQRLDAARAQAAGVMQAAEDHAARVTQENAQSITDAKGQAYKIIEDGRAQSMRDLDGASANLARWAASCEAAKAEHATLAGGIEALQAQHADWTGKLAAVQAEYERVTAEIAAVKARLG